MFVIMREGATPANEEFYTLIHVPLVMRLISQDGWDGLASVTRMGEWEMHTTVYSEVVMELNLLQDCVCVRARACVRGGGGGRELY
jgi:hypothetical protein